MSPPICNKRTTKQRPTFSRVVLQSLKYLCDRSKWTVDDVTRVIATMAPASVLVAVCRRAKFSRLVIQSLRYLCEYSSWTAEDVTRVIMSMPEAAALVATSGIPFGGHVRAAMEAGVSNGKLRQEGNRFRFAFGRYPRARAARCARSRRHARSSA